jgi:hypothetical protein
LSAKSARLSFPSITNLEMPLEHVAAEREFRQPEFGESETGGAS